jgi:hypothetical protein
MRKLGYDMPEIILFLSLMKEKDKEEGSSGNKINLNVNDDFETLIRKSS